MYYITSLAKFGNSFEVWGPKIYQAKNKFLGNLVGGGVIWQFGDLAISIALVCCASLLEVCSLASVITSWRETLEGENFHEIHSLVAICKVFSTKFGGDLLVAPVSNL